MVAACSGSLLTSVVVTPFDVVRVRMQQQSAFPMVDFIDLAKNKVANASNKGVEISYKAAAGQVRNNLSKVAVSSLESLRLSSSTGVAAAEMAVKSFPITQIPSGVGVTTCCKDVFWFPSTIDYCVASQLEISTSCAVDETKMNRLNGTWDGFRKIVAGEGLPALWRGLSLTLLMSVPSNVVYFIAYEYMRDNSPLSESTILNPLICGGLARSLSATVVSPIELVKTRLQSAKGPDAVQVVTKGVREMVATQGFSSLWRGLVLTLWRDVPFSSIYWACVEFIRAELAQTHYFRDQKSDSSTFSQAFIAGSVGGSIAAILTTPFDVGKTRRQIGHHASSSSSMGMLPFMMKILKTEGVGALYVGAIPRILKVSPACAIMISSYEMGKKFFARDNNAL
ncbi:Mtm1p [Sugiyamaella lignohabitans]|uniref:Mtm1p n=1 Tax=Sugiyamaella lignohabitans TaxID=796027 RepID=A0A167E7W9_9ASCO|nr:Mtm1p [Sugiyamaella lignohabitans]ANB13750.1 Mtm1p [Sugiyamaella lignohabitans]